MACTLPYLVDSKRKRQLVFMLAVMFCPFSVVTKPLKKHGTVCVFFFKLGGSIVVFAILNFKKVLRISPLPH